MPKPSKPSRYQLNRRQYLKARQRGWKPLSEHTLAPWENKLLFEAFRVVIKTGVGQHREIAETVESVVKIVPIATNLITEEMREQLPKKDFGCFSRIMGWYAKNPKGVISTSLPKEIRQLASEISAESISKVELLMEHSSTTNFATRNKDRFYHKTKTSFEENFEFQLKHDIQGSFHEIKLFLTQARK